MSSSRLGSPSQQPPPSPGSRDRLDRLDRPDKTRRQAIARACDRCRRRKAKCDYEKLAGTCSHCRANNVSCTFDLPLAKRGPKSKKRLHPIIPPGSVSSFPRRRGLVQSADDPTGNPTGNPTGDPTGPSHATTDDATAFVSPSTSSTASSWERRVQLGIATHPPSPSIRDLAPTTSPPAAVHASRRWRGLSEALALIHDKGLGDVVEQCFHLFFQYLYPLTPLVHEPSLRRGFSFFASQPSGPGVLSPPQADRDVFTNALDARAWTLSFSPDDLVPAGGHEASPRWQDATFTLITAVCAEAAFLLPKHIFPEGEGLADLFLQASRDCLNNYLEADLENPNANSITIRYFHSNCVHAAGKPKYSWHIFGEATRLAQMMRLFDESSFERLPPIEAELRRRAFWIVYMGDKSAAILNHRPITMHRYSYETGITTAYPSTGLGQELESSTNASRAAASFSPSLIDQNNKFMLGFNANLRLWQAASDLLIQIRLLQDQKVDDLVSGPSQIRVLTHLEKERLDSLFVIFITCLDRLPPYLRTCAHSAGASAEATLTEASQFVIQCANLQVSFHCLRMVITQKFESMAFFGPGAEQADVRKTEIVRDMLSVMSEAPFWSLQVNGEPYVEKIRLMGATLLSVIHRNQTSPLAAGARADLSVLLDILTRLDSKASDAFTSTWALM